MDKEYLLEQVRTLAQEKVKNLEEMIVSTRASNNDTKSSMGDKYETSVKCCSRKSTDFCPNSRK